MSAQTLICFASDSRAYLKWLESGRPEDSPKGIPFAMPASARKGDRYLLYVAGSDHSYVGWGTIESNWTKAKRGAWKNVWKIMAHDRMLRKPVTGSHVEKITSFKKPRDTQVVPGRFADVVWSAVRGQSPKGADRAVEGIRTESLSKSRDDRLRLAARQRAKGKCECCLRTFGRKPDDLRRKCLVVHHKKQLKDTDQPRETKLSELAVVCANCHMMIHADPDKALTIAQLQKKLGVSAR